jgi:hypothetical protein
MVAVEARRSLVQEMSGITAVQAVEPVDTGLTQMQEELEAKEATVEAQQERATIALEAAEVQAQPVEAHHQQVSLEPVETVQLILSPGHPSLMPVVEVAHRPRITVLEVLEAVGLEAYLETEQTEQTTSAVAVVEVD